MNLLPDFLYCFLGYFSSHYYDDFIWLYKKVRKISIFWVKIKGKRDVCGLIPIVQVVVETVGRDVDGSQGMLGMVCLLLCFLAY